jgi:hypothetical protein
MYTKKTSDALTSPPAPKTDTQALFDVWVAEMRETEGLLEMQDLVLKSLAVAISETMMRKTKLEAALAATRARRPMGRLYTG